MRRIALTPRRSSTGSLLGNQLFRNLLGDLAKTSNNTGRDRFKNTDIYEEDGSLHYELELPGFDKDEIKVQTKETKLLITGETEREEEDEKRNYLSRRRKRTRVKRSYPLPKGIEDAGDLTAEFENGVLHITSPLPEKDEKETIEVKID